jgi:hypothetical protein
LPFGLADEPAAVLLDMARLVLVDAVAGGEGGASVSLLLLDLPLECGRRRLRP